MKSRIWLVASGLSLTMLLAPVASAQDAPPEPPTARERRLAEVKVERQIAEEEALLADARRKLIPASGIDGEVARGEGAGEAEVLALGARQFDVGARRIIRQLELPATPLLITTGATRPDTTAYKLFDLRADALLATLTDLDRTAAAIQGGRRGVGDVLAIGSSLLSYFRSDFSVAGIAVEGMDDAALAAAVMANGGNHVTPLDVGAVSTVTLVKIRDQLAELDRRRLALEGARRTCVEVKAGYEAALANAETDAARAVLRRDNARTLEMCAVLEAGVAAYVSFATEYSSADGAASLVTILKQAETAHRLKSGDLLVVKVHGAAGSGYTQVNLISHLGGMPFHVTSASVVSWQRYDPAGLLTDAGWMPLYDGYRRLGQVDALINACRNGSARDREACGALPSADWGADRR